MTSVRDVTPRPMRESRLEIARGLETQLATMGITYKDHGVQREFLLHPDRKFAYDLVIAKVGIVVDIDGGAWLHTKGKTAHSHGQGKGFERDRTKDALAHVLGYRPVRFTVDQVKDCFAAVVLEQLVNTLPAHDVGWPSLPKKVRDIFKLKVIGV